eukprot:sb/3462024/
MLSCFYLILLLLHLATGQYGDLPTHVQPLSYDLYLDTNFDTWKYEGVVKIVVDVSKAGDKVLKLHAKEGVQIKKMELRDAKGNRIQTLKVGERQNLSKDLLVLKLDKALVKGKYELFSEFSGTVSAALTGYYRTGYKYKGEFIKMASTHLSPDKSRTVFPSFDEPRFRSTFVLTLVHPSSLTAISNMPVDKKVKLKDGRTRTSFQKTPGMSTYLLAWVQHNFIFGEKDIEGVRLRHYVRPTHPEAIAERLELVGKALKYFNDFFDIPYPLPKLDTIGIPNYPVGGMENWGLITLNEVRGIEAPEDRFGTDEVSYRNLLTHEVSHMWFGNLVTMKWWNDLWLKEGMASYLSYPCAGAIFKDLNMDDFLMKENWQEGMMADDMITSHPVRMNIKSTRQITQIFDKITYSKGAAVLYMLRDVMGEENFKKGMTHFLNTYKFSIAEYSGLLKSFVKFTDEPKTVSRFMDTFILQKNFPLVTVEVLSDTKIKLTQSRYVRKSGVKVKDDKSPFNYSWYVPINIVADTFTVTQHIWLKGNELVLTLPKKFTWLKLNIEGRHMFVTHYPNKLRTALLKQLAKSTITKKELNPRERSHVYAEMYQAAQMNLISYATVLETTTLLRREGHFLPWRITYYFLKRLRIFLPAEYHTCLRRYVISLLRPQWRKVRRMAHESREHQIMFENFFLYSRRFKRTAENVRAKNDELMAAINRYKNASKVDRADIDVFLASNDSEQVELIGNTVLEHPSTQPSRMLDFINTYSERAPGAVWRVYKTHYKTYDRYFGLAQFIYAGALKTMAKHQKDPEIISEIVTFFEKNSARSGELGLRNGLEVALFRIQFKKTAVPDIVKYLKSKGHCK